MLKGEPNPRTLQQFWLAFGSLGADGAYLGETGSHVDQHLAIFADPCLTTRLGHSDYLHLFDACGRGVLGHRPGSKEDAKAVDQAAGLINAEKGQKGKLQVEEENANSDSDSSSSDSDSSSSDSSEASSNSDDAPKKPATSAVPIWLRLLKKQKHIFKYGASRYFLREALQNYGFPTRGGITAPGSLKYVVYSSDYLRQSLRHFRARLDAAEQLVHHWSASGAEAASSQAVVAPTAKRKRITKKPPKEKVKKMQKLQELTSLQTSSELLFQVISANGILHQSGGFLETAKVVQKSAAVYYEKLVAVRSCHTKLVCQSSSSSECHGWTDLLATLRILEKMFLFLWPASKPWRVMFWHFIRPYQGLGLKFMATMEIYILTGTYQGVELLNSIFANFWPFAASCIFHLFLSLNFLKHQGKKVPKCWNKLPVLCSTYVFFP